MKAEIILIKITIAILMVISLIIFFVTLIPATVLGNISSKVDRAYDYTIQAVYYWLMERWHLDNSSAQY